MSEEQEGWPRAQDSVDKAHAWDAIAEKSKLLAEANARIKQLETALRGALVAFEVTPLPCDISDEVHRAIMRRRDAVRAALGDRLPSR